MGYWVQLKRYVHQGFQSFHHSTQLYKDLTSQVDAVDLRLYFKLVGPCKPQLPARSTTPRPDFVHTQNN